MKTICELAGELYDAFETKTRESGREFVLLRDDAPEWMTTVVQTAHGDMLPDDWRYACAREVAGAIHDMGEDADRDDARDGFVDAVDVYNGDLIRWLGSHTSRVGYVDDAVAEYGWPEEGGILAAIQRGQYAERAEVWEYVVASLRDLAEVDA